jgi:hypothetical protein
MGQGFSRITIMFLFLVIFQFLLGPAGYAGTLFRVDFSADEAGKFPSGWESRDDKGAQTTYVVRSEAGKTFLHADAKGTSVQIGYNKEWQLNDFPMLKWQWRAVLLPVNSNERVKGGNDNALGLYVVFGGWPFVKTLKYIWSETLPVGTSLDSPFTKNTKMIVLRSGRESIGTWVRETRDVLADYRRFFRDKDASPVAKGIAILTDADNTDTRAIGDYADIEVSTREQ